MSEAACKGAMCAGGCLDAMVVDELREVTDVVVSLLANDQLDDDQMEQIIDLYVEYEDEVDRRKEVDRRLLRRVKRVILGDPD